MHTQSVDLFHWQWCVLIWDSFRIVVCNELLTSGIRRAPHWLLRFLRGETLNRSISKWVVRDTAAVGTKMASSSTTVSETTRKIVWSDNHLDFFFSKHVKRFLQFRGQLIIQYFYNLRLRIELFMFYISCLLHLRFFILMNWNCFENLKKPVWIWKYAGTHELINCPPTKRCLLFCNVTVGHICLPWNRYWQHLLQSV